MVYILVTKKQVGKLILKVGGQILSLHIKIYKSNFFFIVSSSCGKVLFVRNSGCLGFSNLQKRGIDALMALLEVTFKKILLLKKPFLFLRLECVKVGESKLIYKHLILVCKKNNIKLVGFKHKNVIPHNGCRSPK